MTKRQKQVLFDLILLAVMTGMTFASTVILILGDFTLDTLNLVVIGGLCGWLFYQRRLRGSQSNVAEEQS